MVSAEGKVASEPEAIGEFVRPHAAALKLIG
jgi:hypothetical protein